MSYRMDNSSIYLGRQPILDRDGRLYGYELLFRSAQAQDRAVVRDDSAATATVITRAFGELSLGKALDAKKVFINIGEELLFSDVLEFLSPEQVVLEILETVAITPRVVARCEDLRGKGFTLALDDILEITPAIEPLLPLVGIIKLLLLDDWAEKAPRLVEAVAQRPIKLLAERVETREQFQKCAALGISLFQGYFFTRPSVLQGRALSQDRLTLMLLLNQILEDADTAVLENTFKNTPALSINLLRLTNSVAFGHRVQIISLRHAITLLGRRQLQRWLQLLLFSSNDRHVQLGDNPLLQLAATRACLMEKLVRMEKPSEQTLAELAFMVGIMSQVPAILDISMKEVLSQLTNLPPMVHEALLDRAGYLGQLLSIAESLESDENPASLIERISDSRDFRKLRPAALNYLHCEAMAWAANLGQAMDRRDTRETTEKNHENI
ncbi:MAG: HDOD domain-containing protein [Zoogloeaceae bacterium]|jgi:EAL and modified HD-GYP domain-containing signal transduction protein|nr:HDOD domain-containing protein [Zoogloeaceae bacterium]